MSDLQAAYKAAQELRDMGASTKSMVDAALATLAKDGPLYRVAECDRPTCHKLTHRVEVWSNE